MLAGSAVQYIITQTAEENVISLAANKHVISRAAVHGEDDHTRLEVRCHDDIVAVDSIDEQGVHGGLAAGDFYGRWQPADISAGCGCAIDGDGVAVSRAIDGHDVRRVIA